MVNDKKKSEVKEEELKGEKGGQATEDQGATLEEIIAIEEVDFDADEDWEEDVDAL